jgi:hypothetical protein
VFLRRQDFSSIGLEARINRHSSSTLDFTEVCAKLFDGLFELRTMYRSTGVILADIVEEGVDGRDLFDDPVKVERIERLGHVIDEVNALHGKHTLHVASSHIASDKKEHPRNDHAWRKKALLKGETFRQRLGIPLLNLKQI